MCDTCNPQEVQDIEVENRDIEAMFAEPIGLSTENLVDVCKFDEVEFNDGIKEASKECGMFTAYINAGMTNVQAYELILTKISIANTIEIHKMANATSIEVAKNQSIMIEKNQL